MWSRRSFIVASCALAACRLTGALAGRWRLEIIKWLFEIAVTAFPVLVKVFGIGKDLNTSEDVRLSIRSQVDDIRRQLTDFTPENHLNVRLTEWLNNRDTWISEKPKQGESDGDFAARHQRDGLILEAKWKTCRDDSINALRSIKYLGDELHGINPEAMSFEEWHTYTRLLDNEKMVIEAMDVDMPTDDDTIAHLHDVGVRLQGIVSIIDEQSAELNYVIQKYGDVK